MFYVYLLPVRGFASLGSKFAIRRQRDMTTGCARVAIAVSWRACPRRMPGNAASAYKALPHAVVGGGGNGF
jgi:hypothetical protein